MQSSPSVAYVYVDYVDAQLASDFPRNRSIILGSGQFVIGRASTCHMSLPHRAVSRLHAEITNVDGRYYVTDLGSINGTLINGQELRPRQRCLLSNDDFIQIADVLVLKFEDPSVTAVISSRRPFLSQTIWIDELSKQVFVHRKLVDPPLAEQEFRLLHLLYSRSGRTVSREEIEEVVWSQEMDMITDDMVYNTVSRLHKRLKEYGDDKKYIENVRGIGYRFVT